MPPAAPKPALIREPIYQQLNQELRRLLRDDFKTGDRFLTEREVSDRFHVSRATANKALANLVAERWLEFRKGVGTFVLSAALDYDMRSLVSFTGKAIAAGKAPSTQVLDFARVKASELEPAIVESLKIKATDEVFVIERLRLVDDVPVILEERYVVYECCPGLKKHDLEGSIYELWTERYDLKITGADQIIRAVNLKGKQAKKLGVERGEAGLMITSVGYLESGKPLWFERTIYRGDQYEFVNQLGGIQPARPAVGRFVNAAS